MDKPGRRRPNADAKRALMTVALTSFASAVGRKSSKRNGGDPNDRKFDPAEARSLRRLDPASFDRILRDDED